MSLSALVSGLDAELVRLGYKDSTMLWYRGCWRRLARFFAAVGVEEFSLDLALAWVDEACDFFGKERAGTLKPTDVYLFRVAQMLGDYAAHGAVLRRYSRTIEKVTGDGADLVARFQAWLRDAGRAVSTVRTYATVAGSSSGSWTRAAGWPVAARGRSRRSLPRWRDTSSRPSSRSYARCGLFCGSPPVRDWSTPPCWTWSRP